MKYLTYTAILLSALFFAACASTDDSASSSNAGASAGSGADAAESQSAASEGLLMDRYKSGEIPGYRD